MYYNRFQTKKDPEYRKLINSARWREVRRRKLSDNPLCEDCLQNDMVTGATEVHHVIPIESGMTFAEKSRLAYDIHNLKSLCHECHVKEHIRMGRSGVKAQKRLTDSKLQQFKMRFLMIWRRFIFVSNASRISSMRFARIAYLLKGCKAMRGAAYKSINKFNKRISLSMSINKHGSTPFAPTNR